MFLHNCPSKQLILFLVLFPIFHLVISTKSNIRLHFVSFNVGDNKRMPEYKLTDEIIEKLWQLPADDLNKNVNNLSDEPVYALTLQENCDRCNQGKDIDNLAQQILEIIQKREANLFKNTNAKEMALISLSLTRESNYCESLNCLRSGILSKFSQHGTTFLMIFARKSVILSPIKNYKQSCTANAEKGVIGARFTIGVKNSQETHVLCIAGLHLDPSDNIYQRNNCLKDFFLQNNDWKETCSSMFIAGDFNTRTGIKKNNKNENIFKLSIKELQEIQNKDEMNGKKSYSGANLLNSMINFTQCSQPIRESISLANNLQHMTPTYSVIPSHNCIGIDTKKENVCYTLKRPLSWTDRIICWNCEQVKFYGSLTNVAAYSDHLPVAGLFTLTLSSQPITCKRRQN